MKIDFKQYMECDGADVKMFHSQLETRYEYIKPVVSDRIFMGKAGLHPGEHPDKIQPGDYSQQWALIEQVVRDTGYTELMNAMDFILPILRGEIDNAGAGCTCGLYGSPPWSTAGPNDITVLVSINNACGAVEGLVHELSHAKLYALGIEMESWNQKLIFNTPAQLYNSPVRFDKLRPMGAVVQAQFSYIEVTVLYDKLIGLSGADGQYAGCSTHTLKQRQAYNLKRIGNGIHTLREHLKGNKKFVNAIIGRAQSVWDHCYQRFIDSDKEYDYLPEKGKP